MREILADLVAEEQALDQFLQAIDIRKWTTPTATNGWDIRDTVSHLAGAENHTYRALQAEGPPHDEHETIEDLTLEDVERGRTIRPQQVIEWWREARAHVVDALSRMDGSEQVMWLGQKVSARALAMTRLSDTWARGLDLRRSIGEDAPDTPRLRHIAQFGWEVLPSEFERAGLEYAAPVRVELRAPGFERWSYGPADSAQIIRGDAGDWCRVVVGRADAANTGLVAEGDVAKAALGLVTASA